MREEGWWLEGVREEGDGGTRRDGEERRGKRSVGAEGGERRRNGSHHRPHTYRVNRDSGRKGCGGRQGRARREEGERGGGQRGRGRTRHADADIRMLEVRGPPQ